jgi:predicted permease
MRRFWNWFRIRDLDHDLHRELQYHLDRRVNDLMAGGMAEGDAKRQASMELGGVTQVREEVRDAWLTRWCRDFVYDLRYSVRSFLRTPSFTLTAVLSLALGIGATTAIYSLVDQVILHSLPVREPGKLVLVDWKGDQAAPGFGTYNLMSYPLCRSLHREQQKFFEGVMCRAATTVNLSTGADHKPAGAEVVSGTYFSVLGVKPAMGRLLTEEDDEASGAGPVVVLAHDFWMTQLGGAQDVIGRKVLVNQFPMTVVGVAQPEFRGVDVGQVPALWIPASMTAQVYPGFNDYITQRTRWMQVMARLRTDVSLAEAQTGLQPWFKGVLDENSRRPDFPRLTPERTRGYFGSTLELVVSAQGHSSLQRRWSQPLWVLLAGTAVLLGLACLNVAGLFLARGSARDRELRTRMALGASSGRIGRQLLCDSLVLGLCGGFLGVLFAPVAISSLIAFLPRDAAGNALQASIDVRMLGVALLVSLGAGIITGFTPALQAVRGLALTSALRERGGSSRSGLGLRKAIVTAQVAFTLILVVTAGLFVRTLNGLLAKGPGFDTTSLVSVGLDPVRAGYTKEQAAQLLERIMEGIRTSPRTRSAALASSQLLNGGSWNNPMTVQADQLVRTDRDVHMNSVTPEFFATLGTRIVAGRGFDERDTTPDAKDGATGKGRRTIIVNEAFAKRYMQGRNPIGTLVCVGAGPDAKPDIEVIGVSSTISYRGVREESEQVFFPSVRGTASNGHFYVRAVGTAEAALPEIREIIRRADPALPVTYMRTVDEQISRSLNTERMLAALSGSFGVLALVLSLVGLYGVMSFVAMQRTREIGIRIALGATRGEAVWLVLRDALVMVTAGIAIALPCVWVLGRMIAAQLYGVQPTDTATIAGATVLLATAAAGAAMIPARRASTVSPTVALRAN